MPVKVTLPDGRVVNFPDGMSPADIERAAGELHSGGAAAPEPPTTGGMLKNLAGDIPGVLAGVASAPITLGKMVLAGPSAGGKQLLDALGSSAKNLADPQAWYDHPGERLADVAGLLTAGSTAKNVAGMVSGRLRLVPPPEPMSASPSRVANLAEPMQPGRMTQADIGARVAAGNAARAAGEPIPSAVPRGTNWKPLREASARPPIAVDPSSLPEAWRDPTPAETPPAAAPAPTQKMLNEEAIARRRAEYQAKIAAEQAEDPAARFARQFNTPTDIETRFPKGMRGNVPPSSPLTDETGAIGPALLHMLTGGGIRALTYPAAYHVAGSAGVAMHGAVDLARLNPAATSAAVRAALMARLAQEHP